MTTDERKTLAQKPIIWTGDLSDDCIAKWAGLILRAEWMDENYWWWAVYESEKDEIIIDDSNSYVESFLSGEIARNKAEEVAKNYISNIFRNIVAKYYIQDTFEITSRGIVFAGHIINGFISTGDIIEFKLDSYLLQRKIVGVESILKRDDIKMDIGLLIECKDDDEIEEIRNFQIKDQIVIIYQS